MSDSKRTSNAEKIKISDFVKSISKKSNIPSDIDYRKERLEYLIKKHT